MKKHSMRRIGFILLWLILWQLCAGLVNRPILLAGPVLVIQRLSTDVITKTFWICLGGSFARILIGLFLGAVFGVGCAVLSFFSEVFRDFLRVPCQLMKTVPIACFVVLLLIWMGTKPLTAIVTFLIVFPNLYFQTLEGMGQVDCGLLEMAEVYAMPRIARAWYLYRPAIYPYVRAALEVSAGNAWKAGVAAEMIGLPGNSIGEQIYLSKIYLDTAGVFAWTLVLVLLSAAVTGLLLRAADLVFAIPLQLGKRGCRSEKTTAPKSIGLEIKGLGMRYGDIRLWQGKSIDLSLPPDGVYALMAPSGEGKTTLFRILAGLERAQEGSFSVATQRVALAFEESRFVPDITLERNLALLGIWSEQLSQILQQLLTREDLEKPMREYSLGMKRRAEVARCLLSDRDILLLDEPFNGLDEENRQRTAEFIRKYRNGRLILFSTHKQSEVQLLGAKILKNDWNFY